MANETILVTGATGQVGRRLVPRLLSWRVPGDAVRVLVRTREAAERFEAQGVEHCKHIDNFLGDRSGYRNQISASCEDHAAQAQQHSADRALQGDGAHPAADMHEFVHLL